jgi:hypothetical protein
MEIWARARHAAAWRLRRLRKLATGKTPPHDDLQAPCIARKLRVIEEGLIQPDFPIDIVYAWVDLDDPAFGAVLAGHLPPDAAANRTTMSTARFTCHDELRYSLRSVERYAPWYNRIYIVTNGQVPRWLADHPKVTIVPHHRILADRYLPTFNSHVIGSALHRIPGLSEHYIYFNDDVMLLRPVEATAAFTEAGLAYGFLSANQIGNGPPAPHETATEWAAKNARDLILRDWGVWLDRRLTHMFHPQRRSVAVECERRFAAEYDRFRRNRFRQPDDLLCCSFLHPYVGYITGTTLLSQDRGWYVRVRDASAKAHYARLLADRGNPKGRAAACFNDYLPPDGEAPDYAEALMEFLEAYYPGPSCFERPAEEGGIAAHRLRAAE